MNLKERSLWIFFGLPLLLQVLQICGNRSHGGSSRSGSLSSSSSFGGFSSSTVTNNNKLFEARRPLSDQCFCKLKGQIDDCSCEVDTVDRFNNQVIQPRISSLLHKDFFKYFQYSPNKKCPFWDPTSGKCKSSYCQVKSCPSQDLPPGLNGQIVEESYTRVKENKYTVRGGDDDAEGCDNDGDVDLDSDVVEAVEDLETVDSRLSEAARGDLEKWRLHDDKEADFCELEDDDCTDCVHVDLTLNPERYTGYSGEASRRIWRAIYQENCFSSGGMMGKAKEAAYSPMFLTDNINTLCLEKRAFYRAVSGLHASITIHLSANYPIKESRTPFLSNSAEWGPNLTLFTQRFDPETTNGEGPYWLKNLYFVYLLELRALAKAAPYLRKQTFFTGRPEEDAETVVAVHHLLDVVQQFPQHFDESSMFSQGADAEALKIEFREHFRNITRVMDCVTCDKCKLWGKLQTRGLGTALKILFFDNPRTENKLLSINRTLHLSRNEIVSLFNGFGKISTSIHQLQKFRDLYRAEPKSPPIFP